MRKLSIILIAMLATLSLQARHINKTDMQKAYPQYVMACCSDGYYAFNKPDGGFLILAADDCVPDIVLGWSDTGSFDPADMPDGLKELLLHLEEQVALLSANPARAASDLDVLDPIQPLITSKWNQNSPYNCLTPTTSDGEHCPAGCIAVAMSQIMYFHKWPEQGQGAHSYTWVIDSSTGEERTLSADFSQHTYDWANIFNRHTEGGSTEEQKKAVGQLILDCGISTEIWYRSGGSNGYSNLVVPAFINYFGYDKTLAYVQRDYYTEKEWRDLLYNNLFQGLPVYYRGKTESNGGHAFICDGYKNGLFHINWGWGGNSNGYFQIDLLNPEEQGIGGSTGGYAYDQKAIIGLRPLCTDSVTNLMYCTSAFYSGSPTTKTSKSATFYGTFESETCCDRTYTLGVKVVASDGSVQYAASTSKPDYLFSFGSVLRNITCPLSNLSLTEGEYTVTPAFLDVESGEWNDMRVILTQPETCLIMAVTEDGNVTFSAPITGIEEVANGKCKMGNGLLPTGKMQSFNALGQRVNADAKGLVIMNGKKVVK